MEAFFSSILGVAIAEIGDKTQLLALFLAARFAQKNAVVSGIFIATLLNHLVSAFVGVWLAETVSPDTVKWAVGISFIAVGLWLLLPDKDENPDSRWLKYGAFGATVFLFFMAEIGDKTQIATVLLAAKYQSLSMVVLGSVAGLMLATVPVVYLGDMLMKKNPRQSRADFRLRTVLRIGRHHFGGRRHYVEIGRLKCGKSYSDIRILLPSTNLAAYPCIRKRAQSA